MSEATNPPTDPALLQAEVEAKIAEAEKSRAEASKERASARKVAAECEEAAARARHAHCKAREAELELEESEEAFKAFRFSDHHYRVYRLIGEINDESVAQCTAMLTFWSRSDPKCTIELEIMSNGGEMVSGLALFDYVCSLVNNGHEITTIARGWAASMAAVLLQAGSKRVMGKQASLLIHEAAFGAGGRVSEVKDHVAWVEQLQKHITEIFIARSGGKISRSTFNKNWKRKDWWVDSETALRYGFVDEVR